MFALVDCNNFYASCEEVFNPALGLTPLIILSNNDGCVIARSKKAKELGIGMGDPAYLYKERVENGEIRMLSSNFTLYADMSRRVMQTLESYAPQMEIYSIDEAFFELPDQTAEAMHREALAMRQKVKKWTGIPVSIGVGATKTLAKVANELAKKEIELDGVYVLSSPDQIRSRLEQTAPEDIWGIGDAFAKRLKNHRIYTAAQLIDCNDTFIQKLLGVPGLRTVMELRATRCSSCAGTIEKRKSIVCSRSFKRAIADLADLEKAIACFTSRAAEKLRRQESRAKFLSIFIATSPFTQPYEGRSCHIDLPHPTAYTPELIRLAKEGLHSIFRSPFAYKKAGVLLGNFCDESVEQIDWITPPAETPKKARLMRTIDRINRRYDKNAVQFAAEGLDDRLRSAQAHVSPRFTTSWNELLRVSS
jgi:DNA polymerase V